MTAELDGHTALARTSAVTQEGDVSALIDQAMSHRGRLDGAFNNVGRGGLRKRVAELSLDEWRTVQDVTLSSVFLCQRHQIPAIIRSGGGSIVLTSSNGGRAGLPLMAAYGAAKAGVISLAQTTAIEYAAVTDSPPRSCPPTAWASPPRWPRWSPDSSRRLHPMSPARSSPWTAGAHATQ